MLALLFLCLHAEARPTTEVSVPDQPVANPLHTYVNPAAVAGVADLGLRSLLNDQWEDAMRRSPTWATSLGDHRYDSLMPATGPEANTRAIAARTGFLARAHALTLTTPATESDRLTFALFTEKLETDEATDICHTEQWELSARSSPIVDINGLAEAMDIKTPQDAQNYLARLHASPVYLDGAIANLRAGIAAGRTPTEASARLALKQVNDQLELANDGWSVAAPGRAPHPDWSDADRAALHLGVDTAIPELRAAYARFRDFLVNEELPAARPESHAGLLYLPDGDACYKALIRSETTLPLDPADVHQTGLDALASIHAEMLTLGKNLFGTTDLPSLLKRLRTDPSLYFTTGAEIQAAAESCLARSTAAIPRFFGRLPKASCTVKPIPDYEAPYTYIAYYNPMVPGAPGEAAERGGEFRINLSSPTTRARFEMEVLTWHESIPGHHLQIAIAQELPEMPAFRKNLENTAFTEGWALYTERLADEMGLYTGDLDRMGMLSFDAWRATRLVVDTGIHAQGWTREQAQEFMLDNTALAPNNIANEVDRYITWPGQACAYKIGQIEIWKLRHEAEQKLGPKFDLKTFHDVVLAQGSVTLPVLRQQVEAWVGSLGP